MNTENSQEHEKDLLESLLPEKLQIRCPHCLKPFLMSTSTLKSDKPHFQCSSCEKLFFVPFPECLDMQDVVGSKLSDSLSTQSETPLGAEKVSNSVSFEHPAPGVSVKEESLERGPEKKVKFQLKSEVEFKEEKALELFHCPKCNEKYEGGQGECNRCGLIFKKVQTVSEPAIQASENLRSLWEKVITDYDNLVRHESFFKSCQDEDNLAYASYRYGKIVKAYAGDNIAQKMVRQIEELMSIELGLTSKIKKKNKKFGWLMFFMIIGVAMIGVGFGIPQLRNMVGFGVATIFLTLTMKFYFK